MNFSSYDLFKKIKNQQDQIVNNLSDMLNSFPRGEMGLTPDYIKNSDEYRKIKTQYTMEFHKLQQINQQGVKQYKKEIRKEYELKLKNKGVN
jgi:glycine betaine/choline ABC-type transport system substrate-binding protein